MGRGGFPVISCHRKPTKLLAVGLLIGFSIWLLLRQQLWTTGQPAAATAHSWKGERSRSRVIQAGFIFVHTNVVFEANVHLFSDSLTLFEKCHEMRDERSVPGVLVSFFKLRFGGKMAWVP